MVKCYVSGMNQHKSKSRIQSEIDANLKTAFDQISNEEVPDRFSDLLNQLRAAEQSQSAKEGNNDV